MVFQLLALKLSPKKPIKILIGLAYAYSGLALFLTGANVGFMPAGSCLGQVLAQQKHPEILIPIAVLMGYFIIFSLPVTETAGMRLIEEG